MVRTTKRRLASAVAATAGALIAVGLTVPASATTSRVEPASSPPPIATGDTLVADYSFESGLTGWSTASGCTAAVSDDTSWAVSGTHSALLQSQRSCPAPALTSTPFAVTAGSRFTGFISVHGSPGGIVDLALTFLDQNGTKVQAERGRPAVRGTAKVTATVPAGATQASLTVQALGRVAVDDALVSAQFTDLGEQINVPGSINGTTYGLDASGRSVAYSVITGASGVDARLIAVDLATTQVTLNLPVPAAMGAWAATTAADGTVYITGYNYVDPSAGQLYSYKPGDSAVQDLGSPVPGDGFLYGATPGPGNSVLGGTFPSGRMFKYTPGAGFTLLGAAPVSPGISYVRSVAYDSSTGLAFAGTATNSHIVACAADGSGSCAEILPASYASLPWVYDLSAGDGHVFARVTDDHGNDHLVVIKVARAADGSISSQVVADISGIAYPGTSNVVNGSVYYAKAGELFRYDVATESETDLGINSGIYARTWSVISMSDQADYPGQTLVGINAGGILARYNLGSKSFTTAKVAKLPQAVADLEQIQGGPDGRIYSAGYLTGGLGIYSPMRSDLSEQLSGGAGYGQAEGMTVLDGRVYQGVYPGAYIESFSPADAAAGKGPTIACELGQQQDRPYAMLGAGGKIYAGTMAIYGQLNGALSVYDPKTGTCEVHAGVVPNQTIASLAAANGKIYGGSLIWGGLGATPTESEAKLFVFDPATGTSRDIDLPVRGLKALTSMVATRDGKLWMLAQNYLLEYETHSGKWLRVKQVFTDLHYTGGRLTAYDSQLLITPQGRIYGTIQNRHLFSINSRTGAVTDLLDANVAHVTTDSYGNIYTVYNANHLLRYVPAS